MSRTEQTKSLGSCKNQSCNKHVLKLSFLKSTSEKNLPPVIKSIQSAYEIARFEMHTPQQNFAQRGEGGDVLQTEMWWMEGGL